MILYYAKENRGRRNIGPGAQDPRASFATELSRPIDIVTVLGSTSWINSSYL
jgi:hypothetical protein